MSAHNSKTLFLLGGHDLEMITIRQMLEVAGYVDITASKDFSKLLAYADYHLSWNEAKWKAYDELIRLAIKNGFNITGIELFETDDYKKPQDAELIDHHNEYSHFLCSIEQVAKKLNVQLSRWQRLVAENDKGYIPAMQKAGASQQEIEEIRKADRKAQGVTDEDERLAEKSINLNLRTHKGLTIRC